MTEKKTKSNKFVVKITKISPQKSKKRINLYIDGWFFSGLDLSVALKHSLKVGQEITKKRLTTLVNQSEKESFFQKATNFISYRPRSEKEVRDYLKRKQKTKKKLKKVQNEKITNQIIKRLKKNKFLDDREFAKWWVGQRLEFRPKGKIALKV